MPRRVVVTGVGLLCPVGVGTEECWSAIRAGANGISRITAFDASQFACRIAGEITGFRPEDFVERKEIKKMGRFIQFAIAATDFAMSMARLRLTPENRPHGRGFCAAAGPENSAAFVFSAAG